MNKPESHRVGATSTGSDNGRRSSGVARKIRRFRQAMARRYRIAATRRVLFNLDSHALKDIGLTRGDLQLLNDHRLGEVIDGRLGHRNRFELDAEPCTQ